MNGQMAIQKVNDKLVLKLTGKFDFSQYIEFRKNCQNFFKAEKNDLLEIDFDAVSYIDSSALGMLLALKETCDLSNKKISLVNVKGTVADIFKIANFQKLFSIR
jgi:anti-anti-sigma factor